MKGSQLVDGKLSPLIGITAKRARTIVPQAEGYVPSDGC